MKTPAKPLFLSIGECMLEFSQGGDNDWRLGFAGDTLNTAWYFRMHAPAAWGVAYLTRLGQDAFSNRIAEFLDENGISTRWLTRDPLRQPGLYVIDTKKGERSFTYWRSHSAARLLADDETLVRKAISEAHAIYISGITLAILAPDRRHFLLSSLAAAKAAGIPVAFDPNIRPRLWESVDIMRSTIMDAAVVSTILLPSFDDEKAQFGDVSPAACASRYIGAGAGEVMIKNGGGPMLLADDRGMTEITGLPAVEPVDTTGAGDAFNGAYLAARLAGVDGKTASHMAHERAALVVGYRGALMPMRQVARGQ
jgi:2-dehydro-3-deoxygluconokinase